MVLLPVGAWAVTGSNMFVTDAASGRHAAVDAKNGLVAAVHDAGTGKSAAVNSSGQLQVGGSVTANVASPASLLPINTAAFSLSSGLTSVFNPPAGNAAIVTTITVGWTNAGGNNSAFYFWIDPVGQCSSGPKTGAAEIEFAVPNYADIHTFTLSPGWATPANYSICAGTNDNTATFRVTMSGYTVKASTVPIR
jgi:hypothetical protein